MKNRRGLIVGLVALLVISAGLVVWSRQNRQVSPPLPPRTAATEAVAEIKIGAQGFTAGSVNIKRGTTITWVNADTQPHQVAADPHPDHNSIPGLNSDQLLQPGDSYSFTFEKPGTYTYHDHLHPYDFHGTVVVK